MVVKNFELSTELSRMVRQAIRYVADCFGGPCRGRTYGPLIKSPAEDLPQNTQHEESSAKVEDS